LFNSPAKGADYLVQDGGAAVGVRSASCNPSIAMVPNN
jgi:hypothetical protein